MFTLLKNCDLYNPDISGIKDILVVNDKICAIKEKISPNCFWDIDVIDCRDCLVMPGLIDHHVHITGGGGEQGPISRVPEIKFSEIIEAGVTTVIGLLGFDSISRSIAGLLAKARGLEAEGITTYVYTGSYGSPTETLTGRVLTDIALLDKVIGVGEIAISDYRSNHPTLQDLRTLASESNAGGMLGGKAGVLHLHLGDGKEGLQPIFRLLDESDFPIGMFVPTHINRNTHLFEQGLELLQRGGQIDLTAGETKGYSIAKSLELIVNKGFNCENVTVSSDANGSAPTDAGVSKICQLWEDLRHSILDSQLDVSTVLKTVTLNPSRILKLYPYKGCIMPGSDADILMCNKTDLTINSVLAKGRIVVKNGKAIVRGKFEN